MYLHVGQSLVVPVSHVLAIFDLDNASYSHHTREFLRRAEEDDRVINVSEELPKSFVLCTNDDREVFVYISQLSSATLRKRAESPVFDTSEFYA